jgi:hypothetical protein
MSEDETKRRLPVDFSALVISLAGSAMMHLGEAPNPTTGEKSINLGLARNTIDLLAMLKEKTSGNLDEEETKLMETMLYELRTKFMGLKPPPS